VDFSLPVNDRLFGFMFQLVKKRESFLSDNGEPFSGNSLRICRKRPA